MNYTKGSSGITNGAAANVIPKSDGTNLVTSRITDDGTNLAVDGVTVYPRPYKTYAAVLTQSSTDAPVATVLENTTGATFTWARSTFGTYTVTASSAVLAANKTFILFGNTKLGTSGVGATSFTTAAIRTSTTVITVTTSQQTAEDASGGMTDGQMTEMAFEIRVYP